MKISLNWLKKYVDINISIDELKQKIGARLVEIEGVENLAERYVDLPIVEVKKCEKIAGSDKLTLNLIDDGGVVKGIERDADGFVQVVCGAPNCREGLLTVWLAPGKTVPMSIGSEEPFVMGSRKVFGHTSHGMLAGTDEIFPDEEHLAIIEIDPSIAKPGDDFAKIYELDDYVLEVENKSLTHRPDCFGIIGFAREVAAILESDFHAPEWFDAESASEAATASRAGSALTSAAAMTEPRNDGREGVVRESSWGGAVCDNLITPTVKLPDPRLCPRYECVVLSDVDQTKPFDAVLRTFLIRSGMRSISAAVDITNFLMLQTGQPLHAFDYDKLIKVSPTGKPDIIVRAANLGEKMLLLGDKEIELDPADIVVCAGDEKKSVPIALAGAMGGAATEIDDSTTNILLESATFNLYNLRTTQFRHGIFSEAITRFTKGQPADLTHPVLVQAINNFMKYTGATAAGDIIDNYALKTENPVLEISDAEINNLLGSDYSPEQIEKTLRNLQFNINTKSQQILARLSKDDERVSDEPRNDGREERREDFVATEFKIQAPFWRTDINIPEDVIEEIGRVNGYETLPLKLPTREFTMVESNKFMTLKDKIREFLDAAGANEVLTYTFVSGDLLKKVGQDQENSYKLANSISPELQYIRQQIVPNLLVKTYENLRAGYDKFALFEINQIFRKELGLTDENVPKQYDNLAFVIADKNTNVDFYDAKNYLVKLGEKLGVEFAFRAIEKLPRHENYLEPKHSAFVFVGDTQVGVIGEIRASVLHELKLPQGTAVFELGLNPLAQFVPDHIAYKPLPKFPGTTRDICFQVPTATKFADIENLLRENLNQLPANFVWQITPVDIYAPDDDTKNVTLRIEIYDHNQTIDTKFVGEIIDQIATDAEQKLNAKII
ncbi:phenylalanine--tRNA ligase subunit beta [Candidatus Saccharibacteria bacterium]|nr:phenylalanine--tRNA ligase subunit beta [Candidatus Saccharibacteria bacterium]MCL1962931.1 phenylalanine--tRNA ligase subunit beta [Candidatus Saccharibacteria bacterium]